MDYLVAHDFGASYGYPSREAIMAEPRPRFRWGLFKAISDWKTLHYHQWSRQDAGQRLMRLTALSNAICRVYGVSAPAISEWEDTDRYDPVERVIYLREASIVSLLHELAHHLFGPSEFHACRFSVWIIQMRFKSMMDHLVWQQHLLVRSP